jgi:hypothetical protein
MTSCGEIFFYYEKIMKIATQVLALVSQFSSAHFFLAPIRDSG